MRTRSLNNKGGLGEDGREREWAESEQAGIDLALILVAVALVVGACWAAGDSPRPKVLGHRLRYIQGHRSRESQGLLWRRTGLAKRQSKIWQ